ncbi:MAG TPA: GNAT family N-acetyltransferase, partial [Candidatus Limnocylindria bacterium]|nr:GNAT family N-acetyltransferase [Candidatus Limnocylindria bacterium]
MIGTPVIETPVIETPRLLLRKPTPGDFPRLWGMLTDPAAKEFTGGVTRLPYEERLALFLEECETPFSRDASEFAVIEKESGLYIGY